MSDNVLQRFKKAWHMFLNPDYKYVKYNTPRTGSSSSTNPMRSRSYGNARSVITAAVNRISLDVSYGFDIKHVRIGPEKRYLSSIESPLNTCLTIEANKDQTGRAFMADVVQSMFDEGVVAIVPTISDFDPIINSGTFEIHACRTGKITEWRPDHVRVELYNDIRGVRETRLLPKRMVAIVENPLYEIINKPNGTMRRLMDKLNLLDVTDTNNASGKLDLIIQLPYVIKSEARKLQAEARRTDIENQLANTKYGIAYTDGTEKITQLNRPVENTLLTQVEYLTNLLYSQLGITEAVFQGTADEKAMLNYYDRTVEPIVKAIVDELVRKFLSKTARAQGQSIMGFRDIFKLTTASEIAEMADSLSRNEIVTPNEFREYLGLSPSPDQKSDQLRNRNMPDSGQLSTPDQTVAQTADTSALDNLLEETLAGIEKDLMDVMAEY